LLLAISLSAFAQQDEYVWAGRGPVSVHVPAAYEAGRPIPLVIGLHGGRSSGRYLESYLHFTPISDERGFLLTFPNGHLEMDGYRYWNATDACCGDEYPDDSGYLRDLIVAIAQQFTIDPRRILVFGSSNGGFMANRVGCDQADLVATIVSLSGATWDDPSMCVPVVPINSLQIDGTGDPGYPGACIGGGVCFPSAPRTAEIWGDLNQCTDSAITPAHLDLTEDIPGFDTISTAYSGCDHGGSSTLWTVLGGPHHPDLSPQFSDIVIQYMLSHPKPSDIPCEDVATMRAQCGPGGTIGVDLQLTDSTHDHTTVDFKVDDDMFVAPVEESEAQIFARGRAQGVHVVRLMEPAACVADLQVTCGS
jgi:polyhydroxybutyrate depolymerase